MSENTTQEVQTEQAEQTTSAGAQLQLQDLLLLAQVVALASQRGAFKPEEFTQVGGVYERLISFLKESGAIKPAPTASEESTPVAEDAPAAE